MKGEPFRVSRLSEAERRIWARASCEAEHISKRRWKRLSKKARREVNEMAFGGMQVDEELEPFQLTVEVLMRVYHCDVAVVRGRWTVFKVQWIEGMGPVWPEGFLAE